MKKICFLLCILFFIFLLAFACNPADDKGGLVTVTMTDTPVPTAEPTPTPLPQILLLGTEADVAALEQSAEEFLSVFATKEELANAERGAGRSLVICLDREALSAEDIAALQENSDVLLFLDTANAAGEGSYAIRTEALAAEEDLPQLLLDSLLDFTLHEVPVRLFGLFTSRESAAYLAYDKRLEEGKIFSRGRYVQGVDEKEIGQWISDACEKYIQGTLDGIFCENDEIAELCVRKLAELERTNVEVYSAAPGEIYQSLQAEFPKIAVCSVGYADLSSAYDYINSCISAFLTDSDLPQDAPIISQQFVYSVPNSL